MSTTINQDKINQVANDAAIEEFERQADAEIAAMQAQLDTIDAADQRREQMAREKDDRARREHMIRDANYDDGIHIRVDDIADWLDVDQSVVDEMLLNGQLGAPTDVGLYRRAEVKDRIAAHNRLSTHTANMDDVDGARAELQRLHDAAKNATSEADRSRTIAAYQKQKRKVKQLEQQHRVNTHVGRDLDTIADDVEAARAKVAAAKEAAARPIDPDDTHRRNNGRDLETLRIERQRLKRLEEEQQNAVRASNVFTPESFEVAKQAAERMIANAEQQAISDGARVQKKSRISRLVDQMEGGSTDAAKLLIDQRITELSATLKAESDQQRIAAMTTEREGLLRAMRTL